MAKINATFDIQNSELLGIDTCNICYFKELRFDDKPCKCKIFNKELERYNPVPYDIDIKYWEYKRLQECIDSEV